MSNFFRKTRLWTQVQEICNEYATLRRREYRYALKTKRSLVRMKVFSEVTARMLTLESAARLNATRDVAIASKKRHEAIVSHASKKGAELPTANVDHAVEEYKKRIMSVMQAEIPDSARGIAAGQIADMVMQESFRKVKLDNKAAPEKMNVDLVVAMAKQAGLSRNEVEDMLKKIDDPEDKDTTSYLRDNVLPRFKNEYIESPQGLVDVAAMPGTTKNSADNPTLLRSS